MIKKFLEIKQDMYWLTMYKKLQTFDLSLFIGQSYFFNNGAQNFLIFQPTLNTFTVTAGLLESIKAWQCRGLPNGKIRSPITVDKSIYPRLKWYSSKKRVEFKWSCLKQDKPTFTPKKLMNLFIVYKLGA